MLPGSLPRIPHNAGRAPEHAAEDRGGPERGGHPHCLHGVPAGQQAVVLRRQREHRAARRVRGRQRSLAAGPGRAVAPARCGRPSSRAQPRCSMFGRRARCIHICVS